MNLSDIIQSIVMRMGARSGTSDRPVSTAEDVRFARRQAEALQRDAEMLGVDVDLDRAGRDNQQWTT